MPHFEIPAWAHPTNLPLPFLSFSESVMNPGDHPPSLHGRELPERRRGGLIGGDGSGGGGNDSRGKSKRPSASTHPQAPLSPCKQWEVSASSSFSATAAAP
jgi:hypothetical protein